MGGLTLMGNTGIDRITGMAVNPIDGQLWVTPTTDAVYKIDKSNGDATLVGSPGFAQTTSLSFDSQGKLFGLSGFAGSKVTEMILINTETGIAKLVGSTGYKYVIGLVSRGELPVGVGDEVAAIIPSYYKLHQNFPNPFNPATTIEFDVPLPTDLTLSLYDAQGQLVAFDDIEFQKGIAVPFAV